MQLARRPKFTVGDSVVPAAPTGFVVTAIENEGVSLVWDSVSDPVTYNIERATNTGFTQNRVTVATSHYRTGFVQTGLTVGTTYYYRVRAIYRGINGLWSSTRKCIQSWRRILRVLQTSRQYPSCSGLLVVVTEITVTWQPASGDPPITYWLTRATDSEFTLGVEPLLAGVSVLEFVDTGLPDNTRYFYRLYAQNSLADSPTTQHFATTLSSSQTSPSVPRNLAAECY